MDHTILEDEITNAGVESATLEVSKTPSHVQRRARVQQQTVKLDTKPSSYRGWMLDEQAENVLAGCGQIIQVWLSTLGDYKSTDIRGTGKKCL